MSVVKSFVLTWEINSLFYEDCMSFIQNKRLNK